MVSKPYVPSQGVPTRQHSGPLPYFELYRAHSHLHVSNAGQSEPCVRVQKQNGVARAMLLRILQIALGLSFFLMAGLYLGRSFVPRIFTGDPAVISIAERVFPILAAFIVSALGSV